jgi:glycosyltransferase involved in cell wall biosynthesis
MVRRTLAGVTATLAVSPALARQMRAFEPEAPVQVLGNVIRTAYFTPDAPEEAHDGPVRLLTIALLSAQKGLAYLLQALAELRRRGGPTVELVVGGDGPERSRLEQQARELGLDASCRFVGLLSREEARRWMRWCDLFVLPSLHETFGIVLGEAMACGKPVVATRCGGPEYLVTPESGLLVEPGDADALAGAIIAWMERRTSFQSDVIRRGVVERFGEEAFLKGIAGVYDQVWADHAASQGEH